MKTIRTLALAVAGSALIAGATVPAGAAPSQAATDSYAAEATASALHLSLFGQDLTIGSGTATVTSPDQAAANADGALIVTESFGGSSATASGVGSSDGSSTPACSPLVLPQAVPLLDLSVACSTAEAAVTAEGASSTASGKAVSLSLSGDPLLQPVVDALPLDDVTTTLLEGLAPLLGLVTPVPADVLADQLTDLLGDTLIGDVTLLQVEAGDAEARTSADADSVDATTTSTGATITLLDRGPTLGGPILTIEVGESTTSVSRDRASGETTTEYSAIPVRVSIAPEIAALLMLPQSSFEVPEGQALDLPLPAPLTSSILISGGTDEEIEDGARSTAATLQIDLLTGLNGGVQLGLSNGTASVAGITQDAPTPPTTTPGGPTPVPGDPSDPLAPGLGSSGAPRRTALPRTGAEEQPMQLTALVLALGAAGIGSLVVRSTRRSRAARV